MRKIKSKTKLRIKKLTGILKLRMKAQNKQNLKLRKRIANPLIKIFKMSKINNNFMKH